MCREWRSTEVRAEIRVSSSLERLLICRLSRVRYSLKENFWLINCYSAKVGFTCVRLGILCFFFPEYLALRFLLACVCALLSLSLAQSTVCSLEGGNTLESSWNSNRDSASSLMTRNVRCFLDFLRETLAVSVETDADREIRCYLIPCISANMLIGICTSSYVLRFNLSPFGSTQSWLLFIAAASPCPDYREGLHHGSSLGEFVRSVVFS